MVAANVRELVKIGLFAVLIAPACKPEIEGSAALILTPRVLAVRSLPAEVEPNKPVAWQALYVAPETPDPRDLSWALCIERKPIAVAGPIALECLEPAGAELLPVGSGVNVSGTVPRDVCRVFGPSPAAPMPGEPTPRPADPDSSGGYFQPVRARIGATDNYAVGLTRVSCGVASATVEQSLDYAKRYRPNENPELAEVVLDPDGSAQVLSSDPELAPTVSVGSTITLRASWADCPVTASCGDGICGAEEDRINCEVDCLTPRGCTGSEPYVNLDPLARAIVDRRESMRVSWFSTGGAFSAEVSGRSQEDAATPSSDNQWVVPDTPGSIPLWVIVRDDRGGVGFGSYFVRVE